MWLVHLCKELDDGYGYTFMLHKNVSRETSIKAMRVIININI